MRTSTHRNTSQTSMTSTSISLNGRKRTIRRRVSDFALFCQYIANSTLNAHCEEENYMNKTPNAIIMWNS